jgi:hypothetical protein
MARSVRKDRVDEARMRRKRSKSSGSSLQVERGNRRKKKDTSNDKCQMREMAAGPEKEKKGRERKRNKTMLRITSRG